MSKRQMLLVILLGVRLGQVWGGDKEPLAASAQPKFAERPPQFIVLGVDDCHTPRGLDGLLEIMDAVRDKGGKPIVYVLYVAPSPDFGVSKERQEQSISRLQRMYDRGAELGDHSLSHTAGGGDMGLFRDPHERFMEKAQCNIWLRENIQGLDKIYGYRTDREYLDTLNGEYLAVVPDVKTNISQTWKWPFCLKGMESVRVFYHNGIDLTAPPFHPDIASGVTSDWGTGLSHGFGNLGIDAAVEMLKANFAAHYNSAERTPFTFSLHDFNFQEYDADDVWKGCENEKEIWKRFLVDIFVTEKARYPDTYCITPHQLFVYLNTRDLQQTLAEGNGQKCKPGEPLKNPEEPSRAYYRKFRSTFNKYWSVMGPFDAARQDSFVEARDAPARWTRVTLPDDDVVLWLEKLYKPATNLVAYSRVYVKSLANQTVQLRMRGGFNRDNFKLWLNDRPPLVQYQWPLTVDLKEGWNKLLIKTGSMHYGTRNNRYEWCFNFRITDTHGVPVEGVEYSADQPEGK